MDPVPTRTTRRIRWRDRSAHLARAIRANAAPRITLCRMSFFTDRWYVIERSDRVRTKPRAIQRLGERIVLFRDERGAVCAVSARCPHRGGDLGLGRVVHGQLECPYHGFRFDGEGRCTATPCEGRTRAIPERLRARTFLVREHRGLVFLWHGEPERATELPWMDELPPDERGSADGELVWRAPLARVIEGMLDMHHLPFAHRRVMGGSVGACLDPFEASAEGELIRTRGVMRPDDGKAWDGRSGWPIEIDVRFPSMLRLELAPWLPALVACTPIDAERTWIVTRFWVRVPLVGALLARLALAFELGLVQPDDQRLAETALPREPDLASATLVRADAGIVLWHRKAAREKRRLPITTPVSRS